MKDMHFFEEKCCNIVTQAPSVRLCRATFLSEEGFSKFIAVQNKKLFFAIVFYTLKADIRRLFIIKIKKSEKHSTFGKKRCLIR
jgi:hypothetical protein